MVCSHHCSQNLHGGLFGEGGVSLPQGTEQQVVVGAPGAGVLLREGLIEELKHEGERKA